MKTQKYVKIIIWYLDNFVSFLLDFRKKVCFQSNLSFSNMHSKLFSNLHSEIPIMLKMETIGPIFFSESNKKHKKTIFRKKRFFRFLDPKNFLGRKIFDPQKKVENQNFRSQIFFEFQKLATRIWWRWTHCLRIVWPDSDPDDRKCVPKFTFRCGISGGRAIPLSD